MMAARSIDRAAVVAEARSWIGTPYLHQASLKGVGCDCLGLVRGVWRSIFGDEPEAPPAYSRDWAEALARETLAEAAGRHMVPVALKDIKPGDVLLYAMKDHAPAKHCAIMSADTLMIHAIEAHPVAEVTLWNPRSAGRRLRFAFAFPGLSS